ncbi:MAG: hypothetical protein ACOC7R_00230 [Planctomycetota bacterium]
MSDTIDIPLHPAAVAALRRGARYARGVVARAVLGKVGRPPATTEVEVEPDPAAEVPAPVFERRDPPEPPEDDAFVFDPPAADARTVDPPTGGGEAPAAAQGPPARRILAPDVAPAPRGDVYIAHYYARLPGDTAINPYTRLGGPEHHG